MLCGSKKSTFRGQVSTLLGAVLVLFSLTAQAQEENTVENQQVAAEQVTPAESAEEGLAEEASMDESEDVFKTRLYGYIDAYIEKVAASPTDVDAAGNTVNETNPAEFDVPNINLMVQSTYGSRYKGFLNLKAPGAETVEVSNAWVEAAVWDRMLMIRAGKLYRPFGLYNEILDAVPTYIGIEPPEMFDKDHLLLTRTTNLMVHGEANFDDYSLVYAITTGNDEQSSGEDQFPIGLDLHLDWGTTLKIGTSFYTSAGDAASSRSVGEGSPTGGVATWMDRDQYLIYGGYLQLNLDEFTLQTEFWQAVHDAKRNPSEVLKLLGTRLNSRQLTRFGLDGAAPTEADVNIDADYLVRTFYVRTGYAIETAWGELTPYLQYDFYDNPEAIASKSFGGDNEAGLADDGRFHKATAGLVYRPVSPLAVKIDGSTHIQKFNEETVMFPEIRVSLSYVWFLD